MSRLDRNWSPAFWQRRELGPDWDPDASEPRETFHDGVMVTDHVFHMRYLVTIGHIEGRNYLRSLEIEPVRPEMRIDNATLRRIPPDTLAEFAALFLDRRARTREAAATSGAPRPDTGIELFGTRAPRGALSLSEEKSVPTSAEIAALRRAGKSRAQIAALYGKSPSTISDWIGRAYREVPELMPPRRPGGRKPATTPVPTAAPPPTEKETP